jgi:hypothetical protein
LTKFDERVNIKRYVIAATFIELIGSGLIPYPSISSSQIADFESEMTTSRDL